MKLYLKALTILALVVTSVAAQPPKEMILPNFLKGDPIPEGASYDWTLGATGARGWIYNKDLKTTGARQIYITRVHKRSPAHGVLKVGDVILGIGKEKFSYDPRTEFGKALTLAESEKGELSLNIWREGSLQNLVVNLPVLGSYSATAPYNCSKSELILQRGCKAIAQRMKKDSYSRENTITRSLNALALLASGNSKYLTPLKKEAKWASEFSVSSAYSTRATCFYGYVISFLAEYQIATGNKSKSLQRGLQRLVKEAIEGQSPSGSWDYSFTGPDGRHKGMVAEYSISLTTALVLAREAKVKGPELDKAIEKSTRILRFHANKGSIPKTDTHPSLRNHDPWSRNGMAAVLFSLLEEPKVAAYFSRMSLACHSAERDISDPDSYWNMAWIMPSIALSGPHATGAWMNEYGAWYYDMTRRWDNTFPHQGPPKKEKGGTGGWDATGANLLAYALPLKKIMLTGKKSNKILPLTVSEAKSVLDDGNLNSPYKQWTMKQLVNYLSHWSPVVRERVAIAIAQRESTASLMTSLINMLKSPSMTSRYGASQAIHHLRNRATAATPQLRKNLRHKDLWLRIQSAKALIAIEGPALKAVPELLTTLAKGPTIEDPRGMEQYYLSHALFNEYMLNIWKDQVDQELLFNAVSAGLASEHGRARSAYANIYEVFSFDDLVPLLPSICDSVASIPTNEIASGDHIRWAGVEFLTENKIDEGIELLALYSRDMRQWASEKRLLKVLDMLKQYGAHAQRVIPQLSKTARYFDEEPDFPESLRIVKAEAVRATIKELRSMKEKPKLRKINEK